ncbi:uncharacterized protein METZ01_LOCUS443819, partial [marine metagenome]
VHLVEGLGFRDPHREAIEQPRIPQPPGSFFQLRSAACGDWRQLRRGSPGRDEDALHGQLAAAL